MSPQVHIKETETPLAQEETPVRSQTSPYAERQALAMSWVAMSLGFFVVLAGIAWGAAAVLNAGFAGWLIGVGVMGVVVALIVVAVNVVVRGPRR